MSFVLLLLHPSFFRFRPFLLAVNCEKALERSLRASALILAIQGETFLTNFLFRVRALMFFKLLFYIISLAVLAAKNQAEQGQIKGSNYSHGYCFHC